MNTSTKTLNPIKNIISNIKARRALNEKSYNEFLKKSEAWTNLQKMVYYKNEIKLFTGNNAEAEYMDFRESLRRVGSDRLHDVINIDKPTIHVSNGCTTISITFQRCNLKAEFSESEYNAAIKKYDEHKKQLDALERLANPLYYKLLEKKAKKHSLNRSCEKFPCDPIYLDAHGCTKCQKEPTS